MLPIYGLSRYLVHFIVDNGVVLDLLFLSYLYLNIKIKFV